MVIFDVISSPDKERIGELSIFLENFTLGSSRKADLLFEDEDISKLHLNFILSESGLLIKSSENDYYFSNGKKLKGGKIHKIGDEVRVGSSILKIKLLDFKHLSEKFSDLYKKRLEENPEQEALITQLQKELIHLENNKDV
ncbi:MAG: hypothetical protein CME70_06765 [Halobacteriovorax sp.]|nr:hypothetical protein [Halobacteriovorax sp.]|tara:strand:- start:500049 stop:500471 length:423 start_codon:yes stop_codon:yes gene_type:complete